MNGSFTGVGATLSSNVPIVAERPLYMTQPAGAFSQVPGTLVGATDATAVRPQVHWVFPEGTTQQDFQDYLTILNPALVRTLVPASQVGFAEANGLDDFVGFLTVLNTSQTAGSAAVTGTFGPAAF